MRGRVVRHLAGRLRKGSLIHWHTCPYCTWFWRQPFEDQRQMIADAGAELRARNPRGVTSATL